MLLPTDRITHTTAFVTPVVEHWLEREIGTCRRQVGNVKHIIGLFSINKKKEGNVTFYLKTHSAHFIYGYIYGVGRMVKDYSGSERGNPLPLLHGLLFLIHRKVFFLFFLAWLQF